MCSSRARRTALGPNSGRRSPACQAITVPTRFRCNARPFGASSRERALRLADTHLPVMPANRHVQSSGTLVGTPPAPAFAPQPSRAQRLHAARRNTRTIVTKMSSATAVAVATRHRPAREAGPPARTNAIRGIATCRHENTGAPPARGSRTAGRREPLPAPVPPLPCSTKSGPRNGDRQNREHCAHQRPREDFENRRSRKAIAGKQAPTFSPRFSDSYGGRLRSRPAES